MNLIRPESLIQDLWNQVFRSELGSWAWDRKPNLALHFATRFDVSNHGYEKDGRTHHPEWEAKYFRMIHVIVTARHRAYVAVSSSHEDATRLVPTLWRNVSNHDTWPSTISSVFHDQMMAAHQHCWAHVPEEHCIAPAHMHIFTIFGGFAFATPLAFVEIERCEKPGERDDYFDAIKSVKPVQFRIRVEGQP
jgi:hypothetical protein